MNPRIMKKLLSLGLVLLILAACNRGDSEATFDLNFNESFSVGGSVGANFPVDTTGNPQLTGLNQAMQANGTNADLLLNAEASFVELAVASPAGEDFSFMRNLEIYIVAADLNPVRIAYLDPVPQGTDTILRLNNVSVDIKDYLLEDEVSFQIKGITEEFLIEDHQINMNCTLTVSGNVPN